jgi:hypothetical protein
MGRERCGPSVEAPRSGWPGEGPVWAKITGVCAGNRKPRARWARARWARCGVARTVLMPVLMAILPVALLAACGSNSSPRAVAHIGKTAPTTALPAAAGSNSGGLPGVQQLYQDAIAYTACMRSHGDPAFPAPKMLNTAAQQTVGWDQQLNGPKDRSANRSCEYLLPDFNSGPSQAQVQQALAKGVKFSQCMRAHGIPDFPDPRENSQGISIGPAPGLDASSPRFQRAQNDCRSLVPFGH